MEKLNNHLGAATILNNLSSVYAQIGDSSRAFSFARQAISLREQIGDLRGLNYSYENISRLYWNYNVDSASKYQELSMQLAEQLGITSMKLRSYDNLSVLMDKRRDKQQALQWIQKSIALSREEEDWAGLSSRLRWAAILSGDVKDTIQMAAYFDESLQLINKTNNKAALRDLYASKANAYRKLGDYEKAYVNLQKYHAYRDSLSKEELNANIAKLQLQFDTEKKDIEIERLNTEQRIRQLEIENQRAIISGNKLEAEQKENEIRLLSQQQDLSDAQIRQQAEELERQLLIAQNNQQQIQMAEQEKALKEKEINSQKIVRNFILAGVALIAILSWVLFNRYQLKRRILQQQELLLMRNHIARDLHDEMGSTLTSIKILSQVSKSNLQKDKEKSAALLERITEQSTKMQQGISDIVWAINPNDKLDNMLVKMREFAAETLESKNVETVFAIEEKSLDQSLDMQARRDYFLIYKEAVNNIAKYAQASKVKISIHRKDSELITCITDDGNGFDATAIRSSNGLVNMKSRALALRGSLTITTEPGKGTSIELRIPTT